MKRLLSFVVSFLLLSFATCAFANGGLANGGITTDDFSFFDGARNKWVNFLNQDDPGSYRYYSLDKTGMVVPNDSDGGFITKREVRLLDSIAIVMSKYGTADILPYDENYDALYSSMKIGGDRNRDILKSCVKYIVYTYKSTAQIVFFFDNDDELILTAYIHAVEYNDSLDSAFPKLSKGSKGNTVTRLQTRLKELGFYSHSIDGDYSNNTVEAVKKYQRFNEFEVAGIASTELQALLYMKNAQGILNPDNRNRFIAKGKALFSFLTLASENGYSIENPTRMGEYVFASAFNNNNDYPICYFVESQKVYSVSIIERKRGDIKKDEYQNCAIAMAKSLNYQAIDADIVDAIHLAIANPSIGTMTITNDMQLIYKPEEGMLTIIF